MAARVGSLLLALAPALAAGAPAQERPAGSSLRLVLNLPAYRVDALEGERRVAAYRVAIGARAYPTPTGRFAVTSVTWNPWWYPPPSPWAAGDTATPPCAANPLGRVKLHFAPLYYLHGTNAPRSIGRAASHGCVRTPNEDALALAERVVRAVLPDSAARVGAWAADSATRHLVLPAAVALEIRYELAEVLGDSLHLYPDVYARAPATATRVRLALRALAGAGRDTSGADRARLAELVARSRRGAVAAPLDALAPRAARPPGQ